jgi:uncharacterized protein
MIKLLLLIALTFAAPLCAQIKLDPPGDRIFVLDKAELLSDIDREAIRAKCDTVLTQKAIPIVVVTITTMAAYGGGGMSIEAFATALFNQWGVGHPEIHGKPWNKGILFLISTGDRKARIELGAGWDPSFDKACLDIMNNLIIPEFKAGRFPEGIKAGVDGLEAMAMGQELPSRPISWQAILLIAAFVGLMIFTVVSLIRRGSSGWAWVFWGVVFSVLGMFLLHMLTRGGRSGGFSGGSFGGGSSGGGGASGSW